MNVVKSEVRSCPDESLLSAYLDGSLAGDERGAVENHIASCDECLAKVVAAYESVAAFRKKRKGAPMRKINWYAVGGVASFALSFVFPRYFLQFLVATILLGAKWIIDAKNTRMLVMIYEAWRKGGEKEASRILESMKVDTKNRL